MMASLAVHISETNHKNQITSSLGEAEASKIKKSGRIRYSHDKKISGLSSADETKNLLRKNL